MKKFLFTALLATLALALTMTSCKKDEPEINAADLIGSWDTTSVYYIYKIDGVVDEEETVTPPDGYESSVTFNVQGTWAEMDFENGVPDTATGTWTLSGNSLSITEDGDTTIYTIEKLDSKTLVFSATYHYVEDGATHDNYERMTFTKAK